MHKDEIEEGLGNVYTKSSDFMNSQHDTLTDASDNYDSYINDYSFDNTQIIDDSQLESSVQYHLKDENTDSILMQNIDDFENNESSNNAEYQTTEEMLLSEREREKKTKKELEEEEREKMQYVHIIVFYLGYLTFYNIENIVCPHIEDLKATTFCHIILYSVYL